MDRSHVMEIVDPLFDLKGCVQRDELLSRLDASDLTKGEKRVLHSLWDSKCYTRKEFVRVLQAYGPDVPISYGAGKGG